MNHRRVPSIERLEPRQLLSKPAPIAKFSQPAVHFTDIAPGNAGGSGPSVTQLFYIRNAGELPITLKSNSIQIAGADASAFTWGGKTVPATIPAGETRTFKLNYTASDLLIDSAVLTIKTNDPKRKTTEIPLRGLGQKGSGGDLEPSLQRVLDLHQIPVNVGDSNPDTTKFTVPAATPNDEVNLQTMVKAGKGKVSIEMLGLFVNDGAPAWTMGYYTDLGNVDTSPAALFTVPSKEDAQSAAPRLTGRTKFDPGDKPIGIWASFPAFRGRKSFSQDAMNPWEPKSQNRKKIRFYPLKNPDGTVVQNAYVFACEDWNVDYDFQDGVGIIRNVKPAGSGKNLTVYNNDGMPENVRMVFNKINILDPIRPNVVHDKGVLKLLNSGDQTLTISSLKLGDGTNYQIASGGGSNIKLSPGQSRDVTIQFVAEGSGSYNTYNSTLTITSDDPTEPVKTVALSGMWQIGSEKDPNNKYCEPTLQTVVNSFGYRTEILKPGEKVNTGGKPVKIGDEVVSAYWKAVDPNIGVYVRQIAAYHRQNNFDLITGEPLTAAASTRWFYKGKSSTPTKIFSHNTDEGQSILPHKSGSTTQWAEGTARPDENKAFGFIVDSRYSDPALNPPDIDKDGNPIANTGHAFRFFPLRDAAGKLVPNTYIMAQDYTANEFVNFDYQDNIYIVSNIKPAVTPSTSSVTSGSAAPSLFSTTGVSDSDDISSEDLPQLL